MKLSDPFWKLYELDLQEIKLSYLNWAIGYAREPKPEYRHLFLWENQHLYPVIHSRYGRAFSHSPFGPGVSNTFVMTADGTTYCHNCYD